MKSFKKVGMTSALIVSFGLSMLSPLMVAAAGPATLNLSSASDFAVLSKTGITNVPISAIVGSVGTSPITGASIGLTCSQVSGNVYAVNASGPLPCSIMNPTLLTNAVSDMETAYTNAAGRTLPTATELHAGNLGGQTIAPGLYKWSTDVTIPTNVILSGGANDIWIFQITGNLNIASAGSVPAGVKVILSGGAQASNIFWQVGGGTGATLGTYSTFNGTILSSKQVILQTGAVLNGRALAQTQVTLDANRITIPVASTVSVTPTVTTTSSTNQTTTQSNTTVTNSTQTQSGMTGAVYSGDNSVAIASIKAQITVLIWQLIGKLQAQIAAMQMAKG